MILPRSSGVFRAVEDVEGRVLLLFPTVVCNMTALQQGPKKKKAFSHRRYGKSQIRTHLNLNRDEQKNWIEQSE